MTYRTLTRTSALALLAAAGAAGGAAQPPGAPIVLPKITVKDCGGDAKKVLGSDDPNARHRLMRVYGVASSVKTKVLIDPNDGTRKEYEQIVGEFRAVDPDSGKRFRSGILYLPEGIHDMIAEPLRQAKMNNESAEVTFGMDLYSRKTTSQAGYGYEGVILGNPQEEDRIAQLETRINETAALMRPKE